MPACVSTLVAALACRMLLAVRSSPFYSRLYADGLLSVDFDYEVDFAAGTGTVIIGGESREPEKILEEFSREVERIAAEGFDTGSFERAKRASLGARLRGLRGFRQCLRLDRGGFFDGYDAFAAPAVLSGHRRRVRRVHPRKSRAGTACNIYHHTSEELEYYVTILTAAFQTIQRDSAICFPMLGNLTIDPPSYFTVFGCKVYFYGVIIGLGFILGILYCTRICRRFGIKEDDIRRSDPRHPLTAIIGARLYYVLFELDRYLAAPERDIRHPQRRARHLRRRHRRGALRCGWSAAKKDTARRDARPAVLSGLLIGQILGRWGNFMNREAFGRGRLTSPAWGLSRPTAARYMYTRPSFMKACGTSCVLIFLIIFGSESTSGSLTASCILLYAVWYGIGRALIEGLRTDSLSSLEINGEEERRPRSAACTMIRQRTPRGLLRAPVRAGRRAHREHQIKAGADPGDEGRVRRRDRSRRGRGL